MTVTASLTNFEAVSEFWHYTDTCGETAGLVLEHCKDGVALNGPDVDAVRQDMAAQGYKVAGGLTMSEIVDYFSKHRGLNIQYVNQYGASWDQIHQTLLAHAGRDGIVLEVELAYALTGNEPGVHRHFIAIGGIHPTLGYLVANGDDVRALNAAGGHGKIIPCRWMDKGVIQAARPSACAVVYGLPHTFGANIALPQAHINAAGLVEDGPSPAAPAAPETPAAESIPAPESTPTGDAVAAYLATLTGPATDATPQQAESAGPAPQDVPAAPAAPEAPATEPQPVPQASESAPGSPTARANALAELRDELARASAGLAAVLRVIDQLREQFS